MAINEKFDGGDRIDSPARRVLDFYSCGRLLRIAEGAWRKQQERVTRQNQSLSVSGSWTGAEPSMRFRSAVMRSLPEFFRVKNAQRQARYMTTRDDFAATSSWSATDLESA